MAEAQAYPEKTVLGFLGTPYLPGQAAVVDRVVLWVKLVDRVGIASMLMAAGVAAAAGDSSLAVLAELVAQA